MIGYVIQTILQKDPFIRFTVVTNDGSSYSIADPTCVRAFGDHLEIFAEPYDPDASLRAVPPPNDLPVVIPYTGISKIVKT